MMKSALHSALVLTLVLLAACVRVEVEIPQAIEPTKPPNGPEPPRGPKEPPRPETNRDSPIKKTPTGAALQSDFVVLTQNGDETSCVADRNVTRAVAQETGVWCWAASAEGVMSFHNRNMPQCETVTRIKTGDMQGPTGSPLCCYDKWDSQCQRNGWTHQVFDKYQIFYKWWDQPFSQSEIETELCRNGPFSYSIAYAGGGGHTFVIKRSWNEEEEMFLLVDAHGYFLDSHENRIPAGFKKVSYWAYKEGWYGGRPNQVKYTYHSINQ